MTDGSVHRAARRLTAAGGEALDEIVAEEVAVALVYNGISHAVMMATPCDLEDFARGFSLTERIVDKPSEIYDIEVEPVERGIEVRLDIAAQHMARLQERRRSLAGRTGCGLCGVDSIEAAMRPVTVVGAAPPVSRGAIERAMAALPLEQRINRVNGATHAAGWARPDGTLVAVREDVGRHNALDKLGGALAQVGRAAARRLRRRDQPLLLRDGAQGGGPGGGGDRRGLGTDLARHRDRRTGGHRPGCFRARRPAHRLRQRRPYLAVSEQRIFGITGWKNAGKTTLVERLVAEFVRRGLTVNTVKHGHHDLDVDHPGRDSYRHRAAGATEVAVVGGHRYAIMREQEEPTLAEVLARLAPADLILIEGYKREPHRKIEVRAGGEPMAPRDPTIVAIASDEPPDDGQLPWFRRDDIAGIADFIAGLLPRG